MGWPDDTPALQTYYPSAVLVTGFDIIFFWVARMIMMGLKFMGEVPFREVYLHALVRDHEGQKMSKSKGNILDPLDIIDGVDLETLLEKRTEGMMQPHLKARIEKATRKEFPDGIPAFGTDALRYTFASLATTGRDVRFDLARTEGYHRFCNKLWNASEYVLGHVSAGRSESADKRDLSIADRWIRSRLGRTIQAVDAAYASYRLDLVAQYLYDFTWHQFCDWYLELTKPVLLDPEAEPTEVAAARATLIEILGSVLKLLHPVIPFITEDLWLKLCERTKRSSDTIMLEAMPREDEFPADHDAEHEMGWIQDFIVGVRQIRGEMNLSPARKLPVKLAGATELDRQRVERHGQHLEKLAGIKHIEIVAAEVSGTATALLGGMRILVPLAGLIDVAKERDRLGKQLLKVQADLNKSQRKLENSNFVDNAPADVVAKERARADELLLRSKQLQGQLDRLDELD